MSLTSAAAAFFALALMIACNQNEFTGTSAKRTADAGKLEPKPAPTPNTAKKGDRPPKRETDGGDDDGASTDNTDPEPENTGGDESTDLGALIDNNPVKPKPPNNPLIDLLQGLLNTTNDVIPTQPNDNTIVFGGNKAFHIGDGQQANSSCLQQLSVVGLSGSQYVFEFEVLKAGVDVTVDVELCGIDYSTNTAFLAKDGAAVATTPIPIGATSVSIKGSGLAKGKYSIVVQSRPAGNENSQTPNDHDDFISREVKVRSNGPIKPGKVGTI